MSLRHGLLGLLAHRPASGWDLLKAFDSSLAFTWPATQSQLYTELGRMTDDGLIEVTGTGGRNRKEYAITGAGRDELVRWITQVPPERNRRSDAILRVFFLWAVSPDEARAYLDREATAYRQYHELLRSVEQSVTWNDSDFDRCGRIALEYALRVSKASEEWARWAVDHVDAGNAGVGISPSDARR
jgi:DNA-binding PadR family transcriptional regulator